MNFWLLFIRDFAVTSIAAIWALVIGLGFAWVLYILATIEDESPNMFVKIREEWFK